MKVDVRFATDGDGRRIGELAHAQEFEHADAPIDWSRVAPYWLVAEVEGYVVGALQVLVGYPIGRMDFLFVDRSLSKLRRGAVVKAITDAALAAIHRFGSPLVASSIDTQLQSYVEVAERRGWVVYGTARSMIRRVA